LDLLESLLSQSLARVAKLSGGSVVSLLHCALALSADKLDVSRVCHVRTNATVSTVRAAAHLLRAVALNVGDVKLFDIELVGLTVCLNVPQKVEDVHGGLLGPSNLGARCLKVLSLSVATASTGEAGEGDSALVLKDILEVLLSLLQVHALDKECDFTALLEVRAKLRAASLADLLRLVSLFATIGTKFIQLFGRKTNDNELS
jgi:hypothetical protein